MSFADGSEAQADVVIGADGVNSKLREAVVGPSQSQGMNAFAKRWRLAQLARPGTYELVEVQTRRGVTTALLFPKAILQAEFEAAAPMREAMAIKRERLRALRAKRAAKQRST